MHAGSAAFLRITIVDPLSLTLGCLWNGLPYSFLISAISIRFFFSFYHSFFPFPFLILKSLFFLLWDHRSKKVWLLEQIGLR